MTVKHEIDMLLTSGCSFTQGENSWPSHLSRLLGCDLVNLGMASAGNDYICHSIIDYLEENQVDPCHTQIAVMWSGIGRKDFRVTGETWYWLDDYCAKSNLSTKEHSYWIHSGGLSGWTYNSNAKQIFNSYYKFTDPSLLCHDSLTNFQHLANYLKQHQYRYVFMSYCNYWQSSQDTLHNGEYTFSAFAQDLSIFRNFKFDDWLFSNANHDGIFEFCRSQNMLTDDGFHPNIVGHKRFATEIIHPYLDKDTL